MGFQSVTVPFSTEEGYPIEEWNIKGQNAEWKVRCAWADRYTLANQLVSYPDDVYPYWFNLSGSFSGATNPLYLLGQKIEPAPHETVGGASGATGFAQYPEAIITNKYTNINMFRGKGGAVIRIEFSPSSQALPVSHWNLSWNSDGRSVGEREVGVLRNPCMLYKLTYLRATSIPLAYTTLGGTVNAAAYTNELLGITFPAQTLLYEPGPIAVSIKSSGQMQATVTQFAHYAYNGGYGWNYFWRAEKVRWEQQRTPDGIYTPYPATDWSGL